MHLTILSKEQLELLPLIKSFSKNFYLVGGTAIALQLGHRRSIDFDLFSLKEIKTQQIKNALSKKGIKYSILFQDVDQLHILVNGVKITFFYYPFIIDADIQLNNSISMPNLLTLSAMKAYALGGRNKWKDYVDLYFLLKNNYTIESIKNTATMIFADSFNPKLFKQQLAYFEDINYSEKVDFINTQVDDQEIKNYLTEIALSPF